MELQYFVNVKADTDEMRCLLANKKQIGPGEYESVLPDGRPAKLKIEDGCVYVYY